MRDAPQEAMLAMLLDLERSSAKDCHACHQCFLGLVLLSILSFGQVLKIVEAVQLLSYHKVLHVTWAMCYM